MLPKKCHRDAKIMAYKCQSSFIVVLKKGHSVAKKCHSGAKVVLVWCYCVSGATAVPLATKSLGTRNLVAAVVSVFSSTAIV